MTQVSYSKISCFKNCRRKYWFKYEERLEPKGKSGKLLLGSAVDKAVKLYFKNIELDLDKIKEIMYNEVKMYYSSETTKAENNNMMNITEYLVDLREQETLAYSMLDNFLTEMLDVHTALGITKILEISPEYKIKLKNGIEFVFLPDMIVEIKGKVWVVEIKTSKTIEFDSLRRDDQARSYVWGMKQILKERGDERDVEGIIYIVIRKAKQTAKTKTAMCGKEMFYITTRELELWEKDFYAVLSNMNKPSEHYRNPTMDCGWKCAYRCLCNEDMKEIREQEFLKYEGEKENGNQVNKNEQE